MIKVDPNAAYNKKDLAALFGKSERTINRYYKEGLKKRLVRKVNLTYGYEIDEWIKSHGDADEPINPKILKFRQANGL